MAGLFQRVYRASVEPMEVNTASRRSLRVLPEKEHIVIELHKCAIAPGEVT